jgi:hypothetical protein
MNCKRADEFAQLADSPYVVCVLGQAVEGMQQQALVVCPRAHPRH